MEGISRKTLVKGLSFGEYQFRIGGPDKDSLGSDSVGGHESCHGLYTITESSINDFLIL